MRSAAQVVVLSVLWFLSGVALAGDILIDGVPIPEDVRIVAAADGLSASERRFLGAWAGTWAGDHRHVLVVEEIEPDGYARVVSAIAEYPSVRADAGWRRHDARISGDVLTVADATFTATYEVTPLGTLRAVFQRGDVRNNGKLWPVDLGALVAGGPPIQWTALTRELLDTSLHEDGKPVRLESRCSGLLAMVRFHC